MTLELGFRLQQVVLVLTRSPFLDVSQRILSSFLATGVEVKVYLLYDGVVAAKKGFGSRGIFNFKALIERYIQKGVRIVVDGRECQARGLDDLIEGVEVLDAPVSDLVDDIMNRNNRVIFV